MLTVLSGREANMLTRSLDPTSGEYRDDKAPTLRVYCLIPWPMPTDREFNIVQDDRDAPIECGTGSLDLPETDAIDALATYICPQFPLTVFSILKFCCPKGRNEL